MYIAWVVLLTVGMRIGLGFRCYVFSNKQLIVYRPSLKETAINRAKVFERKRTKTQDEKKRCARSPRKPHDGKPTHRAVWLPPAGCSTSCFPGCDQGGPRESPALPRVSPVVKGFPPWSRTPPVCRRSPSSFCRGNPKLKGIEGEAEERWLN